MLTLIGSVSDHFHFVLASPSKIISLQELTQNVCFDDIWCPKDEISSLACRF